MEQLPLINYPYVSEMEFLQEVKNINGRAKKTTFKHDRITSPFYFLVKIKEVENNGVLTVCFYTTANVKAGESDKKVAEKTFHFGEAGKYYEYIIFFDRVDNLEPGRYRYAIFCNQRLIYEGQLLVSSREDSEQDVPGMRPGTSALNFGNLQPLFKVNSRRFLSLLIARQQPQAAFHLSHQRKAICLPGIQ